ncbi:MAG: DNA cytosine methyltransferase, partial [Halobacteriaceae archaeon]
QVVEGFLSELPYHFETEVLFAADYGVPQQRERVFFIGIRDDIYDGESLSPERSHIPGDEDDVSANSSGTGAGQLKLGEVNSVEKADLKEYWTLWEAISDLPQVGAGEGQERFEYPKPPENEYQERMREGSDYIYNHVPMNHTDRIVERFKHIDWGESQSDVPEEHAPHIRGSTDEKSNVRYDQNNRRLYPHRLSHTITASFYSNFIHPYLHRNFTAREAARIQSFPDTHVFKGKKTTASNSLLKREGREDEMYMHQYGQIGNAVPPLMAKAIADRLGEILKNYY